MALNSELPLAPRLYTDLSWLWPLWGEPESYAPYCQNVTSLIRKFASREVHSLLDLGCGGGKNMYNLKQDFSVSGLDISPEMLKLAQQLNPECRFFQADMRNFCLEERFDAILVDDAIGYMTTEAELAAVFDRVFYHLEPGGVMVVGPDDTQENFIQNATYITHSNPAIAPGSNTPEVVFIENYYDPDPSDCTFEGLILFIIRENGSLRVEQDRHTIGLFPLATWKRTLLDAGYLLHQDSYVENGETYLQFVGIKPV